MNWNGGEMDLDISCKSKNLNTSESFLAGICSLLYVLSESICSSFMIIISENKCLDPEKYIKDYLVSMDIMGDDILTPLDLPVQKKYSVILGYMRHNFLFQYDNPDFLDGIRYCCKILGRNPRKLILKIKDSKVTEVKMTRSEPSSATRLDQCQELQKQFLTRRLSR